MWKRHTGCGLDFSGGLAVNDEKSNNQSEEKVGELTSISLFNCTYNLKTQPSPPPLYGERHRVSHALQLTFALGSRWRWAKKRRSDRTFVSLSLSLVRWIYFVSHGKVKWPHAIDTSRERCKMQNLGILKRSETFDLRLKHFWLKTENGNEMNKPCRRQ